MARALSVGAGRGSESAKRLTTGYDFIAILRSSWPCMLQAALAIVFVGFHAMDGYERFIHELLGQCVPSNAHLSFAASSSLANGCASAPYVWQLPCICSLAAARHLQQRKRPECSKHYSHRLKTTFICIRTPQGDCWKKCTGPGRPCILSQLCAKAAARSCL